MILALFVEGDHRDLVYRCLGVSMSGGTACEAVVKVGSKWLTVAWSEGARARRTPRWPEVLDTWREFHSSEALFPVNHVPVLAEEVSSLGHEALALAVAAGVSAATVGWYQKGALVEYEHVGAETVAWYPKAGLERPRLDGVVESLAGFGAWQADDAGEKATYERVASGLKVEAAAIYQKAMKKLLDEDPPPPDTLAGLIARSATARWRL
jgi:hypothetical protein